MKRLTWASAKKIPRHRCRRCGVDYAEPFLAKVRKRDYAAPVEFQCRDREKCAERATARRERERRVLFP